MTHHTVENLKKSHEFREYGAAFIRDTILHARDDGGIDLAYHGARVAEIRPDNSIILYLANGVNTNVLARIFDRFLYNHRFLIEKRKKAAGTIKGVFSHTSMITKQHPNTSYSYSTPGDWVRIQDVTAVKATPTGDGNAYSFEAYTHQADTVKKDNEKYTAFNRKLKNLKTILFTQAKLGVYDDLAAGNYYKYDSEITKEMQVIMNSPTTRYFSIDELHKRLYEMVTDWVENQENSTELRKMAALCAYAHGSEARGIEGIKRRIASGIRQAQVEFLRQECIKIGGTTTSDTPNDSDQGGELLKTARL